MPKPFTVRLLALDGVWEVPGVDRERGVWAEDLVTEGDRWGGSKASFTLKRDGRFVWPDLRAFNKVEIETDTLCFSGRINGTPSHSGDDRQISVQVEGLQFHLDDDQYEPLYVNNALTAWTDSRASLAANLATLTAAPQVQAGGGLISLVWPQGQATNGRAAVVFDAGPGRTVARIIVGWAITAGAANRAFGIGSADANDGSALTDSTTIYSAVGASSGTAAWTLPTPRRFVFLFHDANTHTPAADEALKISSILVAANTAYESGNASALKAPVVINDALDRGTILLSADRSQIDPSGSVTLNIPTLAPTEPKTPREVLEGVNAYHDYRLQVDVLGRPVFKPKPSAAIFDVGDWSALTDEPDDGAGSEVYNRVIVVATTPDGSPLRVERTASDQPGAPLRPVTSPAPTNPSFDTNISGWAGAIIAIVRDTATFDTSPASGRWDHSSASDNLSGAFTGTFKRGVTYVLQIAMKVSAGTRTVTASFGKLSGGTILKPLALTTTFASYTLVWTPTADTAGASNSLVIVTPSDGATYSIYVDSLKLFQAVPTIVDRQNFRRTMRLPISATLPADGLVAQQIADVWLSDHKLIPFKGTVNVTEGAIRHTLTGETVPLELLPIRTMELLRFTDRNDPDTGGQGRDGRIVAAKWIHAEDRCEISIDNTRAYFDALLARLGAFLGS